MKKLFALVAFLLMCSFTLAQNEAYLEQIGATTTTATITQTGSNNTITGPEPLGSDNAAYQYTVSGSDNNFYAHQKDATNFHTINASQESNSGNNNFIGKQYNAQLDDYYLRQTADKVNTTNLFQDGTGGKNYAKVEQVSTTSYNKAEITQFSDAGPSNLMNIARYKMNANSFNQVFSDQNGHNQTITGLGGGNSSATMDATNGSNDFDIKQYGNFNRIKLDVDGLTDNVGDIYQNGYNLSATIDQNSTGAGNLIDTYQSGSNMTINSTQTGPGQNTLVVTQN